MVALELRGELGIRRDPSGDGREEQLVLDVMVALDLVGEAVVPTAPRLARLRSSAGRAVACASCAALARSARCTRR